MLKPAEAQLLVFPIRSGGDNLLKIYLQDLCLRKIITAEYRLILLNKRDKIKRKRLFLKIGPNFHLQDMQSKAESFILEVFLRQKEVRFYQLRQHIVNRFGRKINQFKTDYVYEDLKEKGLIHYRYFLTDKGKNESAEVKKQIDYILDNYRALIQQNQQELIKRVNALKSHICLLPERIIFQLKKLNYKVLDLSSLEFISTFTESDSAFSFVFDLSDSSFSESFSDSYSFSDGDW